MAKRTSGPLSRVHVIRMFILFFVLFRLFFQKWKTKYKIEPKWYPSAVSVYLEMTFWIQLKTFWGSCYMRLGSAQKMIRRHRNPIRLYSVLEWFVWWQQEEDVLYICETWQPQDRNKEIADNYGPSSIATSYGRLCNHVGLLVLRQPCINLSWKLTNWCVHIYTRDNPF